MQLTMHLDKVSLEQIGFGLSPLREALRSLHVLSDTKRHPLHIGWTLQARKRMSQPLNSEIRAFEFIYHQPPRFFWDIWPHTGSQSVEEELTAFRSAPLQHFVMPVVASALGETHLLFARPLERPTDDGALRQRLLDHVATAYPESDQAVQEFITDPEQCRRRFADLLASYWDSCLADSWPELEDALLQDLSARGRLVAEQGLGAMLSGLAPELTVSPGGDQLYITRRWAPQEAQGNSIREVRVGEHSQIFFAPSYFLWPGLSFIVQMRQPALPPGAPGRTAPAVGANLATAAPLSVLIAYPVRQVQEEGRAPVPPARVLKLLRAAGDMTRLQILQLLSQRARSTRELAGLIGVSEAAISKHLKQLQEAGWISPVRESYYVLYHLERRSLADLTHGLKTVLQETVAPTPIHL